MCRSCLRVTDNNSSDYIAKNTLQYRDSPPKKIGKGMLPEETSPEMTSPEVTCPEVT